MEWAPPRTPPRRAARTDERLSVLSDLTLGVAKGASGDFWEQNRDDGLDEDEADVLTASWTLNQGEGVVRRIIPPQLHQRRTHPKVCLRIFWWVRDLSPKNWVQLWDSILSPESESK